jgi:release factor glutamine methyltransferase
VTLGEALAAATRRLADAAIETPGRDARLLLAWASGIATATVIGWPERVLAPDAAARFEAAIARRAAHEPVSRIIGRREFWSLDLRVAPATLDPRPDTETVVEAALSHVPDRRAALRILDLGTGTGCILLALLRELPNATGIGIDRSEGAARIARDNAAALGLADRAAFAVGDWGAALDLERFDLVVSNPPYIESAEIERLDPDVRLYDPRAALDGGVDGLDAYRGIAAQLPRLLAPRGCAVLELGAGQAEDVSAVLEAAGLETVEIRSDLAGIPRALVARIGRLRK